MTNELFASGDKFFRIFAGILIRPLLSTVYVKDPLNDDMVIFWENLSAQAFLSCMRIIKKLYKWVKGNFYNCWIIKTVEIYEISIV